MPRSERVTFPGVNGTTLAGRLELPDDGPVRGWAVFCHGFALGKNSAAASRISQALAGHGIGVLRYDAAGLGGSTGSWEDGTFSTKVADVGSAAAFLDGRGTPASLLIGHSLGGAAVLAAAADLPDAAAVVTIGAPADPAHVLELFAEEDLQAVRESGEARVDLGAGPLPIRRELVEELQGHDLAGCIASLGRPLLVLHSPDDRAVSMDNATQIFGAARHPRSFVCLEGCDHLMTDRAHTDRAAGIIAAWAAPYLDGAHSPGPSGA